METKAKFLTTKQMTLIALMTALTCILGPLSIPLPFSPVPISFTNLVLYFSVFVLGTKFSTISYIVYLLIGLVGLPVFSGFSGGPAKVAGPTGGYLGMVLGTIVCYLFGTIWLSMQLNIGFVAGLGVGVFPYIPGDLVKIVLACIIGPKIRRAVVR